MSRSTRKLSRLVVAGLNPACLRHAWQYRRPAPLHSETLSFRRDDGVSSVIGALLVLVALTTLLALLQATAVPGMNRDAEAAHADKVAEEFASLQEKVDAAGADGVTRTVKLTPGTLYPQVPFLYNPVPGTAGSVNLLQGQRVITQYSAPVPFSTTRSFTSASFPITEAGLASVSAFTMTLTNIDDLGPPEVTVTASGGYSSTWSFNRSVGGDDLIIAWGANGGGCPNPQTISGYFDSPTAINILACETGLSSFSGLVTLTFTYTAPGPGTGNYTLAGTRGSQNLTATNATAAFLNLSPNYNYWSPPGPTLRYEHGGVVRSFGNTAQWAGVPAILGASHNATSNVTRLTVYVPRLNATNASVSQRLPLSVRLTPDTLSRSQTLAYNLTLEVGTPFPALWTDQFNSTMNASGLPAAGNWSTASGPGWARLAVDRGATPRLNVTVSTATVQAAF